MRIPSPNLDVRDLRVVLALREAGTTASAAEALHLSQSAVSRALAVAEDRAGVALFTRTPNGLVPTDAGEMLASRAPSMLAAISSLERQLREPAPKPRVVRFAAECHMCYPWLTKVVVELKRSAPHLDLRLPAEHVHDTRGALERGDVDAAMLMGRAPKGTRSRALFEDELVFLMAADHPAAEGLTKAALRSHPILCSTARNGDHWFVRTIFGSKVPRLRVQRFAVTEAIVEFARAGLGIGVLSEWVTEAYLGPGTGLVTRRLPKGPLLRSWRLAHRPEATPFVEPLASAIAAALPRRRAVDFFGSR
ncbi:MAG: LysR family transcriptional regulator [Deltaproteobacteria bacterium]|nr:LysR family transcriptional regulator [Deltaproteobacteria bacterium]